MAKYTDIEIALWNLGRALKAAGYAAACEHEAGGSLIGSLRWKVERVYKFAAKRIADEYGYVL